jgi:hypothetical protein
MHREIHLVIFRPDSSARCTFPVPSSPEVESRFAASKGLHVTLVALNFMTSFGEAGADTLTIKRG